MTDLSPEQFRCALQAYLVQVREALGVAYTAAKEEQMLDFIQHLLQVNRTLNLTAITEPEAVASLHIADSWTLLPLLAVEQVRIGAGQALRYLDLGTGAGFPAIPLKIERPELDLVMLDSLAKRIAFLQDLKQRIALPEPCLALHGRAEDLGAKAPYRESFDLVSARAVAELRVLAEYCLPFVKVGGVFVALKAQAAASEIAAARQAIAVLGGELEQCQDWVLPLSQAQRQLLIVRKIRPCPARYPRRAGKVKQQPL